jgi:putative endonuclease
MAEPAKKKNTRQIGAWGEQAARSYLEKQGFGILFQNVYTEYGEIDLVARKDGRLHMVEVKTRRTKTFGHP